MTNPRKKVIIVDDDPIILKLARNILMEKYDVFTVPSAAKLFQLMEQVLPDLILLDVLMPDINGYELIKMLKRDKRLADVPIIFLTSKADIDSELEGFNLGAVDYLVKPFSPAVLLKRVDVQILLESQRQELKVWNSNLQALVEKEAGTILKLQATVLRTISNLVECRDDVTGGHVERTERVLRFLVEEIQARGIYAEDLKSWDIAIFFQSAQLHDVGKIAIRDTILLKPGRLDPKEFEEMKKHTTFGETVIEKIQQDMEESVFLTHARIMAGTHHEKWDGTGYPRGAKGENIPLQGRLMAIADVYDALVSERPYKKAFSHEKAVGIIAEESDHSFDPVLVTAFCEAAERFA